MSKCVIVTSKGSDCLELKILGVPGWDGFDKLVSFLLSHYSAKLIAKFDGPDARRCIFECGGYNIELLHDDMFGNYLLARSFDAEEVAKKIGLDLERSLKGI